MDTNKLAVPIAIVIAGALIAGSLYMSNQQEAKTNIKNIGAENTKKSEMRPVTAEDHLLGNPNAKMVIVEYSDTECPFCKTFHNTMHRVIREYGEDGDVAWVYRHFPIDQLHSKARKEAEATECANELGGQTAFWKYLDTIYQKTPSNDGLDPKQLPIIAKEVGLDVSKFNTCLSSGKYASKVQADYEDAVKSGGRGTPHSVIITKDGSSIPVEGAQPFENIKQTIDLLLK